MTKAETDRLLVAGILLAGFVAFGSGKRAGVFGATDAELQAAAASGQQRAKSESLAVAAAVAAVAWYLMKGRTHASR